jgi:hypothetical protein
MAGTSLDPKQAPRRAVLGSPMSKDLRLTDLRRMNTNSSSDLCLSAAGP